MQIFYTKHVDIDYDLSYGYARLSLEDLDIAIARSHIGEKGLLEY